MQEYKLCPFCQKAVEADSENCTFCNGFLKFVKPEAVNPRKVAAINDPASTVIRPSGVITDNNIYIIQFLSLMTAVLYSMTVYLLTRGFVEVSTMALLLFSTMGFLTGTWISLGRFLKKFNGTADIARPLINMNFYFLAALLLVLPLGYKAAFSQGGWGLLLLSLSMMGAIIAGTVLWTISAVRMIKSPNKYIPLPMLGKIILASISLHVVVRGIESSVYEDVMAPGIFEIIETLLAITPFIYLAWMLGKCRKRIVPDN